MCVCIYIYMRHKSKKYIPGLVVISTRLYTDSTNNNKHIKCLDVNKSIRHKKRYSICSGVYQPLPQSTLHQLQHNAIYYLSIKPTHAQGVEKQKKERKSRVSTNPHVLSKHYP